MQSVGLLQIMVTLRLGRVIFDLFAQLFRQLAVCHRSRIHLIDSPRNGLAEASAIQFGRLPVASEEALLHLDVDRDNGISKGGINDARQFSDQLRGG
jgi:hypothetical protein